MRRAAIVGIVGVGLLFVAGGAPTTAASPMAAKTYWGPGMEARLPANAGTGINSDVAIDSVSCASAGNCAAVGSYRDESAVWRGVLLAETAGRWTRGVEPALPADAAPDDNSAVLDWLSCASVGNCAAVGYYDGSGSGGLLLTETAGKWTQGVEVGLPANADIGSNQSLVINSLSCASAGNCSAVGSYSDSSGGTQGLILNETDGVWATGIEPSLPANAATGRNQGVSISSVSCPSPGNCSAVGSYDTVRQRTQGLLLTETAGGWGTGVEAPVPADALVVQPLVVLTSVSCASAGNCSALGTYNSDIPQTNAGLLLTETAGSWAEAAAVLPANAKVRGQFLYLNSVSCPSAGNCTAVGGYQGREGNYQGLLLTETASVWSHGVEAALPANASAAQWVELNSVSCASAGNCSAGGQYWAKRRSSSADLLVTQTAGRWTRGVEAALPSNAGFVVDLSSVSCPSVGNCSAVGPGDISSDSGREGLLFDSSPTPPSCLVPKLVGRTLTAARRSIKSHHCSVGRTKHAPSQKTEKGHVISQNPRPGSRLKHGAKIRLVVSNGRG